MGVHRSPCRAAQPRLKPEIELVDDRVDPLADAVEDFAPTRAPLFAAEG